MSILGFIANASFAQCKGRRPERVDKLLISRYVWAAGLGDPSFDTMKKWKAVIDNGDPLDMNGTLSALQDAMPRPIKYYEWNWTPQNAL
ncbi:hypothetical protein ColKHC_11398 [Colletotrichum higginsianum]|nr:hypothetical protein ColKHC_11398 [Colletotrichum higginsianum]